MKQFWQENKGSISILAMTSIVGVLMILFLSINIGNIYAKKNLVEDTADAIAPILLAHQIRKHLDNPGSISETPTEIADTILDQSAPSLDKDYNIYFGILDASETFTQLTSLNFSTVAIDPNDPDLAQLILGPGDNFAVNFQLLHEVSPLATLGELLNVSITLQGKSSYATALETLPDPPAATKNSCCCTTTVPPGTPVFFPLPGCSYGFMQVCSYFFPNPSPTCSDFYACQGTFFSNILNGTVFSSFLNLFKCWWADFINRLIGSIRKVSSVVDSWSGWETI